MWQYTQKTGAISHDGEPVGVGYSGHGGGLDNPAMEAVEGVGPIPAGAWRIVEWFDNYENKGPCVARLAPIGHSAHGRTGFLIHGDNSAENHTASDGCIIAGPAIRQAMRASGDTELFVVSGI